MWSDLEQPVYAGGVLWASHGTLEAYNAGNGRWLLSETTAPPGPITVAQGRVFVGSPDGRVFHLSVACVSQATTRWISSATSAGMSISKS